MIKAILLDLGNVIVPLDYTRCYAELESLGFHTAHEIWKRLANCGLVHRFEMGQVKVEEFFPSLCRLLGLKVGYPEFCRIWNSVFPPTTLLPDRMVEGLSQRYRLLLVSNTNPIHFSFIRENYPILRHFSDYVLSFEVGALKPSPIIFEKAIVQAQCGPHQCFFTDDVPAYVEASRGLGMDAVQFHSLEQLEQELRSRGIEWE